MSQVLDLLIKTNLEENRPSVVSLDLTTACNLKCTHCMRVLDGRFMDPRLARDAIEEARELGAIRIGFNGGEPTYHPDFFELAQFALQQGLLVSVNTNGTLHHDRLVDLVSRWRGVVLQISLYGWDDPSSERITAVPNTFSRTMELLERLRKIDYQPRVVLMIRNDTADHLPELVHRLQHQGFTALEFVYRMEIREDGDPGPLRYAPTPEQLKRVAVLDPKPHPTMELDDHDTGPACGAGTIGIDMGVDGTVRPCLMFPVSLGVFRQKGDLRAIWNSRARQDFLESDMLRVPDACQGCPYFGECEYCPGSSYRLLARAAQPHPMSCLVAKIRHDLKKKLEFVVPED